MPIYTYQLINKDGSDGETFDLMRGMNEPALTHHPETGQPCKRIFVPVHIAGMTSELHKKTLTSDANLAKNGFTKYVKNGKGHYERHVGTAGPAEIHAD